MSLFFLALGAWCQQKRKICPKDPNIQLLMKKNEHIIVHYVVLICDHTWNKLCNFENFTNICNVAIYFRLLFLLHITNRLKPQGTVDHNLEPDHLAGQKALDNNHFTQLLLFWAKTFLNSYYLHRSNRYKF